MIGKGVKPWFDLAEAGCLAHLEKEDLAATSGPLDKELNVAPKKVCEGGLRLSFIIPR